MPFVGPDKGAILQDLVRRHKPNMAVEVGTMCGYSALLIAQGLPAGACLITMEADWKWVLAAKRFVWQAMSGERRKPEVCLGYTSERPRNPLFGRLRP